jgi:hypothetical protein
MGEVLVDALGSQRGFIVNPRGNGSSAVQSNRLLLGLPELVEPLRSSRRSLPAKSQNLAPHLRISPAARAITAPPVRPKRRQRIHLAAVTICSLPIKREHPSNLPNLFTTAIPDHTARMTRGHITEAVGVAVLALLIAALVMIWYF